jgi:hypothetical protein
MKRAILALVVFLILSMASLSLAASYGVVTASGTPAQVYAATSAATSIGVIIKNAAASTVTVFIGSDSSVTTSSYGYDLSPGQGIILNGHLNSWWVVTAGTSATISYQILY